jgi:hypothetical protein
MDHNETYRIAKGNCDELINAYRGKTRSGEDTMKLASEFHDKELLTTTQFKTVKYIVEHE